MNNERRCPSCGYTLQDAKIHMDHHLCKNPEFFNKKEKAATNCCKELRKALKKAKETIYAWHGNIAWKEYQHSPEMRVINEALSTPCQCEGEKNPQLAIDVLRLSLNYERNRVEKLADIVEKLLSQVGCTCFAESDDYCLDCQSATTEARRLLYEDLTREEKK